MAETSTAINAVETVADWVRAQQPMWQRADDLLGGTDAMRRAGSAHLPRFAEEPEAHHTARLNQSFLNNFYKAMARNIVGVMMAEEVTVEKSGLPKDFLDNVDRQGRNLHAFAAAHLLTLLTKGAFHILCDYPKNPGVETLEEQQKAGLRPYFAAVAPDAVLDAICEVNGGVERITHVRWLERSAVKSGWGRSTVDKIRILEIGAQGETSGKVVYEVWSRKNSEAYSKTEGPEPLRPEKGDSLSEIPWTPILAERKNDWRSIAPLDDIAHKNVEHWQSSSDQRNILQLSRFPLRYEKGTEKPTQIVGPGMVLHSSGKADAVDFGYIEPSGAAIEAGERDLDRIVKEAEAMVIRLFVQQSQRTVADAETDAAKDKSPLQMLATTLEDGLTRALRLAAVWYGLDPQKAGQVRVPKDFGLSVEDAEAIKTVLAMRQAGDLSQTTLWAELRARRYLKTAFRDEEEQQRLENEHASLDGPDPFAGGPPAQDG